MIRRFFYLGILFFLFKSLLMGQSSKDLEALHAQKFEWMQQRNLDSLDTYLHPTLVYVHSNAWRETKEEVMENLAEKKLEYHQVDILDSKIRIDGTTGIVNGKGQFQVALNGSPLTIHLDYTEVYVWNGSKWMLMSRHACRYEP